LVNDITYHIWDPKEEALIPRFLELKAKAMKREANHPHWFKWKHLNNPWGASLVVYAVHQPSGRLVSMLCCWRWKLLSAGKVVEAYHHTDGGSDPLFTGKGIFKELVQMTMSAQVANGVPISYGFPNQQSVHPYVKWGYKLNQSSTVSLYKPINRVRLLMEMIRNKGHLAPIAYAERGNGAVRLLTGLDKVPLTKPELPKGTLATVRDRGVLVWRYLQNPEVLYSSLELDDRVAVLRSGVHQTVRETSVVDILNWADMNLKAVKSLTREIADETKADVITITLSAGHPLLKLFQSAGYSHYAKRDRVMIAHSTDSQIPIPDSNGWIFTFGDMDHR